MGPDGPTQQETLALIKDFRRGPPTLSLPSTADTPDSMLTARHPGYDARTAQRDPGTVFPLAHAAGRLQVPRMLVTPHLMGRTVGPVGGRRRQREVVEAALRLLAEAQGPSTRRDLGPPERRLTGRFDQSRPATAAPGTGGAPA